MANLNGQQTGNGRYSERNTYGNSTFFGSGYTKDRSKYQNCYYSNKIALL